MEKYVDDKIASMTDGEVKEWLNGDLHHEFSSDLDVQENFDRVSQNGIEAIRVEVEDRMYMAFTSIVPDEEWIKLLVEHYGEDKYQEMLKS